MSGDSSERRTQEVNEVGGILGSLPLPLPWLPRRRRRKKKENVTIACFFFCFCFFFHSGLCHGDQTSPSRDKKEKKKEEVKS